MIVSDFKSLIPKKAVNFAQLLRVLGSLLLVEAVFMLAPLLTCIGYGEDDWRAFAVALIATVASGCALRFCIRGGSRFMGRREGCLLTAVVWVAFSLFGMIPFLFSAIHLNVSESFFEAMSGFTTTGATVIRDVEVCSHGILLWRALTQWVGGLGIVLFTLAIIPSLNNNGGLSMFNAEVSGITHDKLGARVANTAKILWGVYAMITLVLVGLLWAGPMNLFDSICHAMSTLSTGGYSTKNESIAAFDSPYVKTVLTLFMFIGGVNFALVFAAVKGHFSRLWHNDVFRAFLVFIGVNYVLTAGSVIGSGAYSGWESITIDPLFHIVSAMTSTGLGAGNFESWGALTLVVTMSMMYVGACAGSTTGGAKIDRVLYLLKSFRIEVKRAIRPRAIMPVSVNGQFVTPERSNEIVSFLMIYTLMIIFGGVVLSAMGFPIVDAFFSSFSCMSNNGLGAGVTGITGSYDFLPAAGKWVMSFLMLAGRLEVFTVIVLFAPSFWRR